MDDLLSEFLTECAESLSTLDVELVKLEQNPDPKLIGSIFRLVHTVKGTCGFLGLPRLESVAHAAENVLGKIRDGQLQVTSDAVSLILVSIDKIKEILAVIEKTEAEPAGQDTDLIARLNALAKGESVAAAASPAAASPAPASPAPIPAAKVSGLFEQIGGAIAIEATVELFFAKVLKDASISAYFASGDAGTLKQQLRAALTIALGGPQDPASTEPSGGHPLLVGDQLGAAQLAPLTNHLKNTLGDLNIAPALVELVLEAIGGTKAQAIAVAADQALEPTATGHDDAETEGVSPTSPAADETAPKAATDATGDKGGESNIANQSIRVSVQQLENLMTTVSELVLTRNQLLQMVRSHEDSEFKAPLQRLSHITSDLQEGVMKTRMQPIGNAWAKLPRIVRSLAHDLNKKIDLEMVGAETELDRQVLELIKDPLTHMVRNSGDHGLETPAQRKAAGKPETGKIRLNAFHEGGHIIIQITDDGRGIDTKRVRAKAVENGLASEAEAENMSDQQVLQFIFRAGFSTAQQVTAVSGRGVGMDVVRTNIERIGGTVDLTTAAGKGSTFTIKIPLTLAIVSALIVEAGGEKFAIPQISVVELVRTKSDSEHKIEVINGTPVLRLRNRLLPLASLGQTLGLSGKPKNAMAESSEQSLYQQIGGGAAVKAAVDKLYVKVLADDMLKPFFENTKIDWLKKQQVAFFTAALGGPNRYRGSDMRAAHERLVDQGLESKHFDAVARHLKSTLDELGVPANLSAKVMAVVGTTRADVLNLDQTQVAVAADATVTSESFIVVTQVGAYNFGIIVDRVFDTEEIVVKPVSPILRNITMFSGNTILGDGSVIMILDPNGIAAESGQRHANDDVADELSSGTHGASTGEKTALLLFRAGGGTPKAVPLSLIARLEEFEVPSIESSDGRPVVQYRGQLMPLVAVEPAQSLKTEGRQPVLVFADRARSMGLLVDEIIDIIEDHLKFEVTSLQPGLLGSAVIGGKATDVIDVAYYLQQGSSDWFRNSVGNSAKTGRRLLLVDDSSFFRNMLTPVLTAAGYQVVVASGADEALQLLEEEGGFDVIVSDIEMPGKSGFDFAQACRSDERWSQTPILALSAHTDAADFNRGREAGFTDYVSKSDRDALLSALTQSLELAKGAA